MKMNLHLIYDPVNGQPVSDGLCEEEMARALQRGVATVSSELFVTYARLQHARDVINLTLEYRDDEGMWPIEISNIGSWITRLRHHWFPYQFEYLGALAKIRRNPSLLSD